MKLATALKIEFKNNEFTILYGRDGTQQRFEVTAPMSTAKFGVGGGIAIIDDKGRPRGRQVRAFIGISR